MFFKAVVVRNTFWNYCFCFVLLCQIKAVGIFICVEILIKNIFRFNVCGKAVVCHDILCIALAKERNKFIVVFVKRQKFTCSNKVFIVTTIKKLKLFWNKSLIKGIFYFLKTVLFFYIFKCFNFKTFWICKIFFYNVFVFCSYKKFC